MAAWDSNSKEAWHRRLDKRASAEQKNEQGSPASQSPPRGPERAVHECPNMCGAMGGGGSAALWRIAVVIPRIGHLHPPPRNHETLDGCHCWLPTPSKFDDLHTRNADITGGLPSSNLFATICESVSKDIPSRQTCKFRHVNSLAATIYQGILW